MLNGPTSRFLKTSETYNQYSKLIIILKKSLKRNITQHPLFVYWALAIVIFWEPTKQTLGLE